MVFERYSKLNFFFLYDYYISQSKQSNNFHIFSSLLSYLYFIAIWNDSLLSLYNIFTCHFVWRHPLIIRGVLL